MHAYLKDGAIDSYSEELFQKHVPARTEKTDEGIVEIPEVPGLVYDEVIEYDFEEIPVFEDGEIVPYSESRKKAEDDQRNFEEEMARKETRKAEILSQIGVLAKRRDGLAELGEQVETVQAEIDALKAEYASLNG